MFVIYLIKQKQHIFNQASARFPITQS